MSVQLKVSPATALLAGMRFGSRAWPPGSAPEALTGSLVHVSSPVAARLGAESCVPRARGHRRVRSTPSPLVRVPAGRAHGLVQHRPAAVSATCDPVAASWSTLRDSLERDLRYRTRRLLEAGLAGLFADLHPSVQLDGTHVRVATGCGTDVVAPGGRLILMPSMVRDRVVLLAPESSDAPVLLYPVRAESPAAVPGRPGGAPASCRFVSPGLSSCRSAGCLIDDGALPFLLDLLQPYTVDEVAGRHRVRPQEASAKRAELASTGLLAPCPESPVRYQPTNLASVLFSPCCEKCS